MIKKINDFVDEIVVGALGEEYRILPTKEKVSFVTALFLDAFAEAFGEIDTFLDVYNSFASEEFRLGIVQDKDKEIEALRCKLDTYERALKALGSRVN